MKMHVSSMGDAYADVCQTVLRQGASVSPRGMATREILDAVIICDDPSDSLPTGCDRKLNVAIGAAEAAQLVGGMSDPKLMTAISPNFERFMDDGRFHGAYGRRVGTQALDVIRKIDADRDTRQAVITLWDPRLDNDPGKHDYPCTVSLIFQVRDDELNLHVTMRSNDVWWGLAYDAFQFTQLQYSVANALDVDVGRYHHHAVSLHAYERDAKTIEELSLTRKRSSVVHSYGFGRPGDKMETISTRAKMVLDGVAPDDATDAELAMAQVIDSYVQRMIGP
jgi:thymidylate synthase